MKLVEGRTGIGTEKFEALTINASKNMENKTGNQGTLFS